MKSSQSALRVGDAKARGNNPLKIYQYVRNHVEYLPTYGSIEGSDYTEGASDRIVTGGSAAEKARFGAEKLANSVAIGRTSRLESNLFRSLSHSARFNQRLGQTLRGNDMDQASLLIALLRAANIPSRYVYGTIRVPIKQIENWVGNVTDPHAALK